jgi:DNA primase
MSISPRLTQDVRDRLTLSEVIGRKVKLTRAGREFKGCCPFHREKSASFYVNDDKQFYHCFGCGAHGDVFGFVMQHDNLSFPEALEVLASQANVVIPSYSEQDKTKSRQEKNLYALCDEATKWFEANLVSSSNKDILNYVTGRGLTIETIESFRLGYAPPNDQALRQFLKGQGYTDAQMLEVGLLKQSSSSEREPYSFFRERLMFPVSDIRGRVVAFGGRILPEHLRLPQRGDFKPPKYINSSDTPLFHKGRTLYAVQHARMAAKDLPLIVVEGYMDVIACHQAGFKGTVAPLGTALTEDQISMLWKMIPLDEKTPVLCFDGDEAGYRAAYRSVERILPLLKPNQSLKIAFLPSGEDPDTFIRQNGAQAFQNLIAQARPILDFLWIHHTASQDFKTPESRAGLSAKFDTLTAHITDGQLQYHYKQMFRDKLRGLFGNQWKPSARHKGAQDMVLPLPILGKNKADTLIPKIMVLTLVNHPFLYESVAEEAHKLDMSEPDIERLYHTTLDILERNFGEEEERMSRETLHQKLVEEGYGETLNQLIGDERLYMHAAFARPLTKSVAEQDVLQISDKVIEGWKSLMSQWSKSILKHDVIAARMVLAQNMSPENEDRMRALKQAAEDLG